MGINIQQYSAAWAWATLYVCAMVATWIATQTGDITPDRFTLVETGNIMQHHSGRCAHI